MTENPKCILLVDDDQDDHYALKEELLRQNISLQIKSVYNGMQALDYLRNCPAETFPHLIIMDYNMPVMSGAQVLAVLDENKTLSMVPVVVWTTSENKAEKVECLRLGAIDYFIKPRSVEELERIAGRMVELL